MNKIVKKNLLAGNKFMPEMHFKPFAKNKEVILEIQNVFTKMN